MKIKSETKHITSLQTIVHNKHQPKIVDNRPLLEIADK